MTSTLTHSQQSCAMPVRPADDRGPTPAQFVQALARRDFTAMASCLDPQVRFRALVPPGLFELAGTADTMDMFRRWYGGEDDFALLEATVARVGSRTHLRWRIRLWDADGSGAGRLVEQHAFATGTERITELDLLCSGWQAEDGVPRPTASPEGTR